MADDLPGDPRETAARRLRMGAEYRASLARMAKDVEDAREANRRFARNQNATRIPSVPDGASRPMETARAVRIPPRPVATEGLAGAAARGIASRAAGASLGGLGLAMTPTTAANAELPPGQARAGMEANIARRRAMAEQIGRDVGRAQAPPSGLPERDGAQLPRPKARDAARIFNGEELPLPPKPPRNPPRQAARRPSAPVESDADKLNAMEIDRIMRDRASEDTGAMKKGGKVKTYKKGGAISPTVKLAKGGAVRGCGIVQRGKTRGAMR